VQNASGHLQATLDLLKRDVTETIMDAHTRAEVFWLLENELALLAAHGWDEPQRLVDDVQQIIHDIHADTTWPQCPVHPNHPMWFKEGAWRCEKGGLAIPLGALNSPGTK
jgi:hypothetical protein